MTRINVNISPKLLCDKHLLAEHREIKRICNRLKQRLSINKFGDIPTPFSEQKNNTIAFKELFWLDKGLFTYNRYLELHKECITRGFNVQNYSDNWDVYKQKPEYWNNYNPTNEQITLIALRINTRLISMNQHNHLLDINLLIKNH